MKKLNLILIFIVYLTSCSDDIDQEANTIQFKNDLFGDWKGNKLFYYKNESQISGNVGWSFRITNDSLYAINYPFNLVNKSKLRITKDSMYLLDQFENNLQVTWSLQDSILSMRDYITTINYSDSSTYFKTKFDKKIIDAIIDKGYNPYFLENTTWQFHNYINNSKKSELVPKEISFQKEDEYHSEYNSVSFENDTFYIAWMDQNSIYVSSKFEKDTIYMEYRSK